MVGPEQGGVLVMTALWLPLLLLFVVFVIDVGNWFAHHRHLQTQADAAALAGAADFRLPCNDAVNASIAEAARRYSGERGLDDDYNPQIGDTSPDLVDFELNSRTYPGDENPGPVDDTVVEGPPCEAGMVDVKMTETDLPLFFPVLDLFDKVGWINTHARVEIFQRESISGALPVGVPDNNPRVGRVIFMDESTVPPTELGSRPLERNGIENDLAIWDNSTDPFPLTVNSDRIGVRVAFGGATSTTCGDPLVQCYDLTDPTTGILRVRGYSMAGSGAQQNAPLARNVYLTPGNCLDPYFHDASTPCTIGVHAEVDFGPCETLSEVGASLEARQTGSNTWHSIGLLSCPAGSSTSVWETPSDPITGGPIVVDPDSGPVPIELRWEETKGKQGGNDCTTGGGNKCKGAFGPVHRTFSAVESRTGPIRFAQLWEGGSGWANSFERCSDVQAQCTYSVWAKIGIDLNLEENATSVDDPVVALRFGASSGSQNQALDCNPPDPLGDNSLRAEIAYGCYPEYTENEGAACPATPILLWASPQPWDCVALETGDKTGQIWQGMNLRVHGTTDPTTCESPNNWADFEDPGLDPGDPRIVSVFLTPFGSFSGSGAGTVPVTGFATFYATGWHGSQSVCPDDDPAPSKSIVGHFIKYVQAFNDGTAGTEPCDFDELASCVAVMTR